MSDTTRTIAPEASGAAPASSAPPTRGPTPPAPEGPAPASSQPPVIEALAKRVEGIDQRVSTLENQRVSILEFSFQSILVVLTILGLAAGVPFALLYGTKIATGDVAYFITALLVALVAMMIIWLSLWWKVNVNRISRTGNPDPKKPTESASK